MSDWARRACLAAGVALFCVVVALANGDVDPRPTDRAAAALELLPCASLVN